jgi:uncharacterized membrane protein YkvA (DUF1232 family)
MDEKPEPPIDETKLQRDEARVRAGFWPKFGRVVGRIPFAEELLAAYYCATDPATPLRVKAILMGAVAYFVMPVDMVPDFIAGLGFADDATVLLAAYRAVRDQINETHRQQARDALTKEKPHRS